MIKLKINPDAAKDHYQGLKARIQQRAVNILAGNIGTANNPVVVNPNIVLFLESLATDANLEHLITALPEHLPAIINHFQATYSVPATSIDDFRVLKNLFVDSIYDLGQHFNKLDFVKRINIDTCVYCNRNYIYYLSGMVNDPIKPEIDHFFPKTTFPYLALSFYNLIPSCSTCNGREAKGTKNPSDYDLVNPYLLDEVSPFLFSYNAENMDVLRPLANKFGIRVYLKKMLAGHNGVFKLDKLYEQHADHVAELIVKGKGRYPDAYREYLNSYDGIKFDDFEIERLIIGNYTKVDEIHKRPLSKLYQDIGRELGLINKLK